jgi:cohesin loading factor subunit SCC2
LLKQFEEHAKSSLPFMLYLADNLAYIPFTVVDEPLFVIHHIDIMISVSGSNLLQTFKEKLKPPASCEARTNLETGKTEYIYDEDLDDDEDSVFDRLPDNVKDIQEAITCSQGCLLLLVLREHLKDFYGFTTARINEYSPTDVSKANERAVNRRNNVRFNPKATIDILSQGEPPEELDDDQRRELVQKYMEFKELMNKMDPDEEEEDEDGNPIKRDRSNHDTPIGRVNSNSNKNTQIQSSTPSPSKPTPQTQQNIHSVPMYNNIPQQPITPIPQTNPNHQHMQYNPEYYQYQQQQMMLLEEQNRRLAAERYPQHMVAYPQGNVVNNHQPQHHGNIPRVPDGMVLDPMTGELVPAGGMRHF